MSFLVQVVHFLIRTVVFLLTNHRTLHTVFNIVPPKKNSRHSFCYHAIFILSASSDKRPHAWLQKKKIGVVLHGCSPGRKAALESAGPEATAKELVAEVAEQEAVLRGVEATLGAQKPIAEVCAAGFKICMYEV